MNRILIWVVSLILMFSLGFYFGVEYNSGQNAKNVIKENVVVATKNDNIQKTATKSEEQQIVYRDRIVTKYKTIKEEVIKYEVAKKDSYSPVYEFDDQFICLYNSSTINPEITFAGCPGDVESAMSRKVGEVASESK